jgi:tagaturonate epimerase
MLGACYFHCVNSTKGLIMQLEKYSIGIGDRFGFEATAQLRALQMAEALLLPVVPVWNKSNREHSIIGTSPDHTRARAEEAVRNCHWKSSWYVDADHIGIATVDRFLASSNFFTIDVADFIGKPAPVDSVETFLKAAAQVSGTLTIPGVAGPIVVTHERLLRFAATYLGAMDEAARVYRYVEGKKGAGNFVPEVSVDEAEAPQTPTDLLLILVALAHRKVPVQTIAPKFTGAFLKGVDYVGDIRQFTREFDENLAVIAWAVKNLGLPPGLKLSVHSGSDKFSLYPIMHEAMQRNGAGLHLKTAGTTWLEEVIGLAAAGGTGLALAKEIYSAAHARYDELAAPYRTVIDIDRNRLPDRATVLGWNSTDYVEAIRHDRACPKFNRDFRQLVHIGYKVASEMGDRFTRMMEECRSTIESNVTANIYHRHIRPLFMGTSSEGNGNGHGTQRLVHF